jgi:hypothetical protein
MDADREAVRNTMTPDAPHSYRDRLNRIVHEHSSDPMSASQAEAVYTLAWDMAKKLDAREPEHGEVRRVLKQLSECGLSEDNCASFDVANRRIRALARQGLNALDATSLPQEEK